MQTLCSTLDYNMSDIAGAPTSQLFEVRDTEYSGRAVFATQDIATGTPLLQVEGPVYGVLNREYRKEVCAQCFAYDQGKEWKIRSHDVGFVFCSMTCQIEWLAEHNELGIAAWAEVEKFVKGRPKEDEQLVDVDAPNPNEAEITHAWQRVEVDAANIRLARAGSRQKHVRKSVQRAMALPQNPDALAFLLSGVLAYYTRPEAWPFVLELARTNRPYWSHLALTIHVRSYLQLLSVVPIPLLDYVTPAILFEITARDSHNSFGIRSLSDDGSEFFGFGVWAAASYWNHSCAPNVRKRRVNRTWYFEADRDIKSGEELRITYLSGDERALGLKERRDRLRRGWGFTCDCEKCKVEEMNKDLNEVDFNVRHMESRTLQDGN